MVQGQMIKLYSSLFQRRRILKFSFFVPMFQTCDPGGGGGGGGAVLTPKASYEQPW